MTKIKHTTNYKPAGDFGNNDRLRILFIGSEKVAGRGGKGNSGPMTYTPNDVNVTSG